MQKFTRWIILFFISLAMFGNYYIYDSISPMADLLVKQLNFTDANIGLLQAIYSAPNIIMVLIGGIIIDKIGTRRATFIFSFLCFLGAVITAMSSSLTFMATGRLVFGLGAESMIVAVTTAIAKWFKGKELSFAFGLNLTIARLGSFAALNSPSWAKEYFTNWQYPLLISVVAGIICVAGAIIYFLIEQKVESNSENISKAETEKFVLADLFKFGLSFWLIVGLCVTFYSAIFPFQTFAVKYFQDAHGVSREVGGFLSSILTLFAMIATPLFGLLADKVGKRSLFMIFGSMILIPAFLIMTFTKLSLFIPMAMMGVSFSLIPAIMWPSVAYLVEEKRLGTAYGMMTLVQNIGLTFFNLLIGNLNDMNFASNANPNGYIPGLIIFATLGVFGILFSFLLRQRELSNKGHGLEQTTPNKIKMSS